MLDVKALINKLLEAVKVDFVVEEGTSGIWTYRKWNSGIAECWGTKTENKALTAWGSWYYVRIDGYAYPTDLFTTVVWVDASIYWKGGDLVSAGANRPAGFQATAPNALGVRPTSISGTHTAVAFWHAIGKWK